jgi:hypothetical protein
MGTLVDMNSEPAVEDLSRQILSEAKLWEAIQEARVELLRRRQEQVRMRRINGNLNGTDSISSMRFITNFPVVVEPKEMVKRI